MGLEGLPPRAEARPSSDGNASRLASGLVRQRAACCKTRGWNLSATGFRIALLAVLVLQIASPSFARRPLHSNVTAHPLDPLEQCANEPQPPFTYGKIRMPSLHVEAILKSARPRHTSDVTIITQCSVDRLYMLEAQCRSWSGLTSVAIYWPLFFFDPTNTEKLTTAIAETRAFHKRMEAEGACRLDMVVLSEVIKSSDTWSYPYNALRNQALARAGSDVILAVDADFLVVPGLHEKLSGSDAAKALLEDLTMRRQVVVLPAFETDAALGIDAGAQIAVKAQTGTKQQLQQMYEARQVIQFAEFYPVGHRSTNYPKFFNSSTPYAVKFKTGYEPYILVSRRAMPWYDERFRGYGWDKVMQLYQLDSMNFQFVVHPTAFVIHRPHIPSSGYNHTFTGEAYTKKHKPTDHLWKMERIAKDMMAELKSGTYPDIGVTTLSHCSASQTSSAAARAVNWW
ncbi:hypothetical protein WJX74_010038 [Apatococcus lobatus]|uniref:Uncharacterized protein n=1 Tax=Apatococcus lobatus TaxID=904363 RepID=A0AAW1QWD6_9CHLO